MMTKKFRACGSPGGFSLVELVIVLAVLAILAAFLLPALAPARERGRQATCMSNLHQLGLAVTMYLDDYHQAPPPRFQAVVDGGYVRAPAVLLCPDDPTHNWGGLLTDHFRRPETPPESVHYSYVTPFGWPAWQSRYLLAKGGPSAGIAACQLHGDRTGHDNYLLSYEGLVLRLQRDGAVVRRRILWQQSANGVASAHPWRLLSDSPVAESEDEAK